VEEIDLQTFFEDLKINKTKQRDFIFQNKNKIDENWMKAEKLLFLYSIFYISILLYCFYHMYKIIPVIHIVYITLQMSPPPN